MWSELTPQRVDCSLWRNTPSANTALSVGTAAFTVLAPSRPDLHMTATGLLLALYGLTVGQPSHIVDREISRPHWVIMATVVNRHTGQPVKQGKLEGSALAFDDRATCESILELIGPIVNDNFEVLLTCTRTGIKIVNL
jgi:hypothetical protein